MTRFANKTALITGGTSGIGLATAREFLQEGAQVAINGRNSERLQQAVAELGDNAIAIQADVASLADIERMAAEVGDRLGKLDALFVNAGIVKLLPIAATTEAFFDELMSINFKGAFFTVQKLLPFLNEGAGIVFNTSVSNQMGIPNGSVYAASKAAMRSLVRTLANEWVDRKIRVNAVSPGPVETPIMGKVGLSQEQMEGLNRSVLAQVPMKRFGQPQEIAKAVLFLASSDASFMTGEEIVVDGGWIEV